MTTNSAFIQVDPERVVHVLEHDAVEQLNGAGGDLVLDFSAVLRIDANAARAMEELAGRADSASVKVALRAVNIDIYRALKLLKLTGRFSFLS